MTGASQDDFNVVFSGDNAMVKNILVVDNSPVILKLISHILLEGGHVVKTAENGISALEILESFVPDIIFVDLIMPKISGDILCRIIRSRKEFHNVLLVILSAVAAEEENDYIRLGADAYIAKGPAAEMAKHINYVIEHCKVGEYKLSTKEVLGIENVHKREITAELLSTKRHFEITLENMTDGFIEMTLDSKIIYANTMAAKFFQLTKEQLISSVFHTNFPHKHQGQLDECVKNLHDMPLEIGEEEVIEIHGVQVLLKFIRVREKNDSSIIVLIRDISRQKKLKEQIDESLICLEENIALRTKEYLKSNQLLQDEIKKRIGISTEYTWLAKQLSTALDMMPDLISVHDQNMKIVRVNKAFMEAIGSDVEELIGTHCYKVMHRDGVPSPHCPHLKAAQENRTVTEDVYDFLAGKTMRVTCSPCYDDDGTFLGTVHIARDAHALKNSAVIRDRIVAQLQDARKQINQLADILPFCSSCRKIRDDKQYWKRVETYILENPVVSSRKNLCPDCMKKPGLKNDV